MRSRIIVIAGISTVAVAIVVTAAWFFFVLQTQRAIIQWAEIQRENGVDITWQDLRFTGYPLRIDVQIGTPQMIVRQRNRRVIWEPSLLTFKLSSITPHVIDFVSPGAHDLQFASDNAAWSAVIEAETLEGQAKFPPDGYQRIEQLVGQFAGVRVTPFAWVDPVTIEQGNFEATLRAATPIDPDAVHPRGNSFEFALAARDIGLPKDLLDGYALAALGPLISEFSTEVLVKGELAIGSADIDTLTAWRDGGGTVEITSIELQWGPLRITADGTLALDGDLQPVGSFATRIAGLQQFISAMETGGVLSPSDAAIARITLAVLTRPAEDGGPNRAEIPITLQERILRLGPIALIELPPIVWE
jgi:hypothetical protein